MSEMISPKHPSYLVMHDRLRLHREWYESPDLYQPGDELLRVVRGILPYNWELKRSKLWFYASPPIVGRPKQGWKIHLSAAPTNCEAILQHVAAICLQAGAPFKFALDRDIVNLISARSWPRENSGKFITVFPLDDNHFRTVIETLYDTLPSLEGPYILSDRCYRDSRVVFYRYGCLDESGVLSVEGERYCALESPEGRSIPDRPMPYWAPPAWVSDPFQLGGGSASSASIPTLKGGRYSITQALEISNSGGVYRAIDSHTDDTVIIKEARPATATGWNGDDAVDQLRNECRLLEKVRGNGFCPAPLDLFTEWEHLFLVVEQLHGLDLSEYVEIHNPYMSAEPDANALSSYAEKLRSIWTSLAQGIAELHEIGIVCGELSIRNVVVEEPGLDTVRMLGLDGAWEDGEFSVKEGKLGLVSPTGLGKYGTQDDSYALGLVLLGTLFPVADVLEVERGKGSEFVITIGSELGIGEGVTRAVVECFNEDPSLRPSPRHLSNEIRRAPHWQAPTESVSAGADKDLRTTITAAMNYCRASAALERTDRLFPADANVFLTNPLSVAYGATGVAYALHQIEGEVPKPVLAWILSRSIAQEDYPPGLYLGLAGIAWLFWELGLGEVALQVHRIADDHPLLWSTADLFYGAAGYGLSCLFLHDVTGEQALLDRAAQVGDLLDRSRVRDVRGCRWPDDNGEVYLGYARGGSGIALFLLYLHAVTGEERFMRLGEEALAFDLTHAYPTAEGNLGVLRGAIGSLENAFSHCWFDGSAGVATVVARYWAKTKNPEYYEILQRLAPDTFRRISTSPSLFRGLAGLGNFLLDAFAFTGEEGYLREAHRAAEGVMMFRVQRPSGTAFPGDPLRRLSTDFATGSAGIALFLHRLVSSEARIKNFNFTLDHLLSE
jgi:hypothetical protein